MKNYLQAIRTLPSHYVLDDTRVTEFVGGIVAVNPKFVPIIYTPDSGWSEVSFLPVRQA